MSNYSKTIKIGRIGKNLIYSIKVFYHSWINLKLIKKLATFVVLQIEINFDSGN
jgi:hypothetical protein